VGGDSDNVVGVHAQALVGEGVAQEGGHRGSLATPEPLQGSQTTLP
jgi:hypothetical protein